jgi:hypothetical protein
MTTTTHTYDYVIRDIADNGEFLSWATVDYLEDESETFCGTSEDPPGYTGEQLALSSAAVWLETRIYTIEERLGPYGLEWEREQEERRLGRAVDLNELPF